MKRWLVTFCLLGTAVMAAPGPVRAADEPAPVLTLRDRIPDAAGRMLYDSLRRLPRMEGLFTQLDKAVVDGTQRFAYGYPAGDLNRDGRRDVIAVDYAIGLTGAADNRVRLHAVSGRSGKRLFRLNLERPDGFLGAIPARLGKRGHAGLLVFELEGIFGPLAERRFALFAYNGKGKKLWEREYKGVFAGEHPAYVGYNVPVSLGMFDGLKGRQSDFLVGLADFVQAGTLVARTQARALHGSDGREVVHPDIEVGLGVVPEAWTTGNLGGGPLDDYVFLNLERRRGEDGTSVEPTGVLRARTGTRGELLWESDRFEWGAPLWVYPMNNIRGNGRDEVAVSIGDNEQQDPFIPIYLESGKPGLNWELRLFDGADGFTLWKSRGGWAHSIRDADRDGTTDIASYNLSWNGDSMKVSVFATGGDGGRIWKRVFVTRTGSKTGFVSIGSGFGPAGDLQPDGAIDLFVSHDIQADELFRKTVSFSVDGRRGRKMRTGGAELFFPGSAIDGRGADLVVARVDALGRFEVQTQTGGRGRRLWLARIESDIPSAAVSNLFYPTAATLDRDRCSEILFATATNTAGFVTALDGGNGSTKWSYRLWGSENARSSVVEDKNRAC